MRRLSLLSVTFIIIIIASCTGATQQLENGSFTAQLNGFAIHYEVHGSGPALMTVPNSWGLSLEGLRALYRPLETQATLVYFDPRGMGESEPTRDETDLGAVAVRQDFHALREHLGLERVNAIGWSNGATNLVFLASERPETIAAAIFLHGVVSFDDHDIQMMVESYPELFEAFGQFQSEMDASELGEQEQAARVKVFDSEVWFPYLFADPETGKKKLPELFRDTEFSWAHAQYANKEWPTLDARDRLADITARSLVITGRHDMTPPEKGAEIAAGIADSRHELFEDSGHFAPVEEPQRFAELVQSFLDF